MGINTNLADANGIEITLEIFQDAACDFLIHPSTEENKTLLNDIGTALFWIHSHQNHTGKELDDVLMRSRALERQFRDIGEQVIRNVLANGGKLSKEFS